MIEKLFPRLLNNSSDSRVRKGTEMSDALNVQVGGESEGSQTTGDLGVLKPINGNTVVGDYVFPSSSSKRVIGKAEDGQQNRVYFFVYSSNANEQGVYVYDNITATVDEVFTHPQFNFQPNGFVKGDVIHLNNQTDVDADERTLLYFTDNVNEPRKLDVERVQQLNVGPYNQYDFADLITACPRTPVLPPTFAFSYDPDSQVNNFEGINGFQFAYQNIYYGGEESALSTYSDIAVPPSYVNQGNLPLSSINIDNVCTVTIPVDGYTKEIEKVRLLARYGNSGNFYIIDDITPDLTQDTTYEFRNAQVITAIPQLESDKQFDALPKRAQAQAITENRLFYGNYVEGFDPFPVTATLTAVYNEREQDFANTAVSVEPIILKLDDPSSITLDNRVAGFKLDLSTVPTFIPAGSEYTFSMTVGPDRNWHIYDARYSMHGTRQLYNTVTGEQEINGATVPESVQAIYQSGDRYFGGLQVDANVDTRGLLYNPTFNNETDNIVKWNVELGPQATASPISVAYGTSAANPLIVKGGVVTFIVKLLAENDISQGQLQLRNAICAALNEDTYESILSSTGFQLVQEQSAITPSYSFNLELNHGDTIQNLTSNPNSYLITAVGGRQLLEAGNTENLAPCGYFIVDGATVRLRCRSFLSEGFDSDSGLGFVGLEIDSIEDTNIKTCVPDISLTEQYQAPNPFQGIAGNYPEISKWVVLNPSQISEINQDFIETKFTDYWYSYLYFGNTIDDYAALNSIDLELDNESVKVNFQIERIFGFLQFEQGAKLYQSVRERAENSNITDNTALYVSRGLSLLDGDAGPRGVQWPSFRQGKVEVGIISALQFFKPGQSSDLNNPYLETGMQGDESLVEAVSSASFLSDVSENSGASRSFKSSANHDFGVVYYDQRGRSSNVNPVGSVYVAGYSPAERGADAQGRVSINVQLQEEAPDWAFHYQIVYGGNSTVNRFVQYTTGGAFVPTDSGEEQNIFVSLNYLQNNDDVSYVDAFGARSPEGNNRLYEFREGDKLRVISYYNEADQRVFPTNYVFDVVGLRDLGDDADGNPLTEDDQTVPKVKQGDFLVLRNNPTASGFRYADVQAAGDAAETFLHNWNSRCVVEIFSPSLSQEAEERVFYEVSDVYPTVINADGVVVHSSTDITLTKGDVWWRRMAVNMPEPPGLNGAGYTNLIGGADGDGFTAPSFRAYHLESETFSDLVRNADVYSYGKVKAILPNSKEVRRRSSVTFGEGNNYASKLVRFTSFNPSLFPFKDLPNRYGAVNFLEAFNEFLLVIQEDKLSRLPVSRQILSDAAGNQQLIASDLILGTQAFYAGDFGCDNNPESVVVVDNDIYFANKSVSEVYRFNRNEGGVRVISDNGMEEFFERLFRDVGEGARVVGGYDPLHSEFLISVHQPENLPEAVAVQFVKQPIDGFSEVFLYGSTFGVFDGDNQGWEDQLGNLTFKSYTTFPAIPLGDTLQMTVNPDTGAGSIEKNFGTVPAEAYVLLSFDFAFDNAANNDYWLDSLEVLINGEVVSDILTQDTQEGVANSVSYLYQTTGERDLVITMNMGPGEGQQVGSSQNVFYLSDVNVYYAIGGVPTGSVTVDEGGGDTTEGTGGDGGDTAPTEVTVYQSDFSTSSDGFIDASGSLLNVEFAQEVSGETDALKVTALAPVGWFITRPISTPVEPVSSEVFLTLDYFIPESSTFSAFQFQTNTQLVATVNDAIKGAWNTVTVSLAEGFPQGATMQFGLFFIEGGTGVAIGDAIYVKNISIYYSS